VTCADSKSDWKVGAGSMRRLPTPSERMEALLRKEDSGKEGSRTRWYNWKGRDGGTAAMMMTRMEAKENIGWTRNRGGR
jgi:hypothetical protein